MQAIAASQAIADPMARTLTLAGAAGGLASKDSAKAASALEEASRVASNIKDPAQQLSAAAMMVGVAGQLNDAATLRATLERGFSAADALQAGSTGADQQAQFTLQRLVGAAFRQDSSLTLSFIEQVRVPATKAGLLVDAAQSLLRSQRGPARRDGNSGNGQPSQGALSPPGSLPQPPPQTR